MGFSIYYRSLQELDDDQVRAIESDSRGLSAGRTWLACEPPHFFPIDDGYLFGGSKPNFQPHPDDAAAAAAEGLPDGTVADLIAVLCELSSRHGVDWEIRHDYSDGPVGTIRVGTAEPGLMLQIEGILDLANLTGELGGSELPLNGPSDFVTESDDEDDEPRILKFPGT